MNYEILLNEATKENIYVIEKANFESRSDGLINGNVIGLNKNITTYRQKACVLAEELGHYHTTVGNILDQSTIENQKQEYRARAWAYNNAIGLYGIIQACKHNCISVNEAAEYLDVTEQFFMETVNYYKSKYGHYAVVDNYMIFFEPLSVLELYK